MTTHNGTHAWGRSLGTMVNAENEKSKKCEEAGKMAQRVFLRGL